jgi:hypothetical protein
MLLSNGGPRRSITEGVMDEPLAFKFAKFCRLAGMGKTAGYAEVAAGRLKVRKRGRSTIVLADEGREYLQSLPRIEPQAMENLKEEEEPEKAGAEEEPEETGSEQEPEKPP